MRKHGAGTPPRGVRLFSARGLFLLALVIGTVIRAAYFREVTHTPQYTAPVLDAGFHHAWAMAWSSGQWADRNDQHVASIPQEAYFRPPGYAFYLSGVYRLFGTGGLAPRAVQALLGLTCLLCVYGLGRRISPWAGGWAALLFALYWPAPYFEACLLDSAWTWTLSAALALALVTWAETSRMRWLFAAGVTMGVCAVIRPNVLLFAPAAAGWVAWRAYRAVPCVRRAVLSVLCLTVATVLPILPVTLRNACVSHQAVLISSNGGINFYIGNGPYASGAFSGDLGSLGSYNQTDDNVALARGLSVMTGQKVTDRDVGHLLFRQALGHIRSHSGAWLRLMAHKLGLFWGQPEVRLNSEPVVDRNASRVLRWVPLSFGLLAALGLAGFFWLPFVWPRHRTCASGPRTVGAVCALSLTAWMVAIVLFFVTGQYRQAVAPLLAVGGGSGWFRLDRRCARGSGLRLSAVWRSRSPLLREPARTGKAICPTALFPRRTTRSR